MEQIKDLYDPIKRLGAGEYGEVYKAKSHKTGEIVAVKRIKMEEGRLFVDGFPNCIMREICFLKELKHPNIVELKEVIRRLHVFLVFSYCESDLEKLARQKKLTEAQIISYTRQMLIGLTVCHTCGISHRDLKPSNIFVNRNNLVQIGDFGLASRVQGRGTARVITINYRPLELLMATRSYASYGTEVDMWSMGCIIYEIITGKPLFPPQGLTGNDESDRILMVQIILRICGNPEENGWPEWRNIPGAEMFADTIRSNDMNLQTHLEATIQDPYKDAIGLILSMLKLDPSKRITAEEAFKHPFLRSPYGKYDPRNMIPLTIEEQQDRKGSVIPIRRGGQGNQ